MQAATAQNLSIYDLLEQNAQIENVLTQIESGDIDAEGADQALYDALIATDEAIATKLERYAKLVRSREALAKARSEEAKHLAERAKVAENEAARLKKVMKMALEALKLTKVDAGIFTVAIQANGGVTPLNVDLAPEELPEAYRTAKTVYSANQEAIRAALDKGEELPFARYGERGNSLRIR